MNFVFPFAAPFLPPATTPGFAIRLHISSCLEHVEHWFPFLRFSHRRLRQGELRIALFIMECWRMLAPKANEQQVVITVLRERNRGSQMRVECFETFFFFFSSKKFIFFPFFLVRFRSYSLRFTGFPTPLDIIPSQLTARTECRANDRTDEKKKKKKNEIRRVYNLLTISSERNGRQRRRKKKGKFFSLFRTFGAVLSDFYACVDLISKWIQNFTLFFFFSFPFISFNEVFLLLPSARTFLPSPVHLLSIFVFCSNCKSPVDGGALRLSTHPLIRCDNDRRRSIDCTFRVDENWESLSAAFAWFECSRGRKGMKKEKKEKNFNSALRSARC